MDSFVIIRSTSDHNPIPAVLAVHAFIPKNCVCGCAKGSLQSRVLQNHGDRGCSPALYWKYGIYPVVLKSTLHFWAISRSAFTVLHLILFVWERCCTMSFWDLSYTIPLYHIWSCLMHIVFYSPPARWGLLDFMSVASSSSSFSSSSSRCPPRPPAQLRLAIHSVRCRTSTTTIHAQCSLPNLNHDHPRPAFPAGPQPRPSPPSVPCRISTTTIHAQCSLPDLNREYPRPVFPAGPQPRPSTPSVPCRTSTASIHAKRYAT